MANAISKQLKKGIAQPDVKVSPFGDKTRACQMDCTIVSPFES